MSRVFATLSILAALTGSSSAASCVVADPTGTPLNVRDVPGGVIIGTLPNGFRLRSEQTARDNQGQRWTFVVDRENGDPVGWVFRDFIRCR